MKCQIQWIGADGKPTADSNEAVAVACYHGAIFETYTGRVLGHEKEVRDRFPICAAHLPELERMVAKGKDGWSIEPLPAA